LIHSIQHFANADETTSHYLTTDVQTQKQQAFHSYKRFRDKKMRDSVIRLLPQMQKRYLSTVNVARKSNKVDFDYCVDLVHDRDREGYLCGLLMPHAARRSYFAIRALNVELASIKDAKKSDGFDAAPGTQSESGILLDMAMSCWKNPVVRVLNDAVEESKLTKRFLERLLDAREADLDIQQPETIAEAIDYADNTFSSLLYLSLETTNVSNCRSDLLFEL
jgi:hypothetical protein